MAFTVAENSRRYRERHPGRHAKHQRRYQKRHPGRYAKSIKRYRKSGRHAENNKRYRHRHPELILKIGRRWHAANPENGRIYRHTRRARLHGNGGSFTTAEWIALKIFYDNKCLCCGKKRKLEPDHVLPLSKGGRNDIFNIQPLCLPCNRRKGTKDIDYR
jgi:5-methylcytosine-specific restriction endonuclease McrA